MLQLYSKVSKLLIHCR